MATSTGPKQKSRDSNGILTWLPVVVRPSRVLSVDPPTIEPPPADMDADIDDDADGEK